MAADSTLVQGAGLVARSKGVGKLAGAKAFTDVSRYLSEGIGKVVQKRNREFNTIMNNQLNQEGLSDDQWETLYKELEQKRGEYVYLNKKFRTKAEQEIVELGDEIVNVTNLKGDIATASFSWDKNNDIKNTGAGKVIMDFVSGENNGEQDENGNTFFNVPIDGIQQFLEQNNIEYSESPAPEESDVSFVKKRDGYYTPSAGSEYSEYRDQELDGSLIKTVKLTKEQLKALAEYNQVDEKSASDLNAYVKSLQEKALNLKPGENFNFNYTGTYQNLSTNFVAKGNLRSMMEDGIIPGRNFKEDFITSLQEHNYEEFGIGTKKAGMLTKEGVLSQDPTPGDGPIVDGKKTNKITLVDAAVIYNSLKKDMKLSREMLTHYYTQYAEQNFLAEIPDYDAERRKAQIDRTLLENDEASYTSRVLSQMIDDQGDVSQDLDEYEGEL